MIVSEPKAHQHALSLCGVGMRLSRLPAMEANIQPYPFHHLLSRLATLNITQPSANITQPSARLIVFVAPTTVHVINISNIHRTRLGQMGDLPEWVPALTSKSCPQKLASDYATS
jgi:hypothetical protein